MGCCTGVPASWIPERVGLIELPGAPVQMDEHILDHVLSHGLIPSDQERGPKGARLVTPHRAFNPANIAVFQAANGLQVFPVWLHACGSFARYHIYNQASKKVGASQAPRAAMPPTMCDVIALHSWRARFYRSEESIGRTDREHRDYENPRLARAVSSPEQATRACDSRPLCLFQELHQPPADACGVGPNPEEMPGHARLTECSSWDVLQ